MWQMRVARAALAGRKIVVFELQIPEHWIYVDRVLAQLSRRDDLLVLVASLPSEVAAVAASPRRPPAVPVVPFSAVFRVYPIHLFASLTQFTLGFPRFARTTVLIPHGLPSKGNSLNRRAFTFQHLFLTGPILEGMFNRIVDRYGAELPGKPQVHRAGYPRSDAFGQASSSARDPMGGFCVLYAPSFEEKTSLEVYGESVVEHLLRIPNAQVLVKLHPMLFHSEWIRRIGRDWPVTLRRRFGANPRFRLLDRQLEDDTALEQADVLVTDVSGIAYEFLLHGKGPVVYLDCPEFYEKVVRRTWDITSDVSVLGESVFSGRELGIVVGSLDELEQAVTFALSHPDFRRTEREELRRRLVFNFGSGCDSYVRLLLQLLGRERAAS